MTEFARVIDTEKLFKVNIRQLANGERRFDVTAKGDTEEEVKRNLDFALKLAMKACYGETYERDDSSV